MKSNKTTDPFDIVADMKAACDAGAIWDMDVYNLVVSEGKIPKDWCKDNKLSGTCERDLEEGCRGSKGVGVVGKTKVMRRRDGAYWVVKLG